MTIDVVRHIGATYREVGQQERDGKPARTLVATRIYDGAIHDVWSAITEPARLARWFLPLSGELRVGGHYQLEGNAGGEITACDPPQRLELTWGMHGGVSWVTVRLTAMGKETTKLELEHAAHLDDDLWDQFGPGAAGVGWELTFLGLAMYLDGSIMTEASEREAWPTTPEGKAFVRGISDGWAQASITAGTAAANAKAAADRTTAFYTGEPAPGGG